MPYLTQNEIEAIARRVVSAYQRLPIHNGYACWYIDPDLLATELLGLKVEYHALSPDGRIHGLTVFSEAEIPIYDDPEKPMTFLLDGKTILVEQKLIESYAYYGRWHFTVAHETSHQIYRMLFPKEYMTGVRCRTVHYDTTAPRSPDDWEEWRTDVLASAILMPEDILRYHMKKVGLAEKLTMLHRACNEYRPFYRVAVNMGVSTAALALRMKRLGLLDSYYLGDPNDLITAIVDEDETVEVKKWRSQCLESV